MHLSTQPFKFKYPRILSIAGSDSNGGAGIQVDLKTFSALGGYGMTALNTLGVRAIHSVLPGMLKSQIDALMEGWGADGFKIGILHSAETVQTVAEAIDRHALKNVVLDPVMVATSSAVLIENPAIAALVSDLFKRAVLVTPNLDEAALLVRKNLVNEQGIEKAAQELLNKGGHLAGDVVSDLLLT